MQWRKPRKNRTFMSLFLTLALVLAVPLTIIFISFNTSLRAMVLKDYFSLNEQVAANIHNAMDTYVAARMDFAYALTGNQSLRMMAADVDDTLEETSQACRELHQFCRAVQAYDSVYALAAVYLPDRDMVISSKSLRLSAEMFYTDYMGFSGMDSETFFEVVRASQEPRYLPATYSRARLGSSGNFMLYVQPLSLGYLRHRAYYLSLIDQDAFARMFMGNLDENIHFQLLDSKGTALMHSDRFPAALSKPVPLGLQTWPAQSGQEKYHVFYSRSGITGLQYLFFMPETLVLKRLTVFQQVWAITAVLCLAIGVLIARSIAARLYKPFQSLLREAFPEGVVGTRSLQQEYSLVAARMRETQDINRQFQEEIDGHYQSIRASMLMKLLTQSRYLTPDELEEAVDITGLPSDGHFYKVAFLDTGDQEAREHILQDGQTRLDGGVSVRHTALSATQHVVVFAAATEASLLEASHALLCGIERIRTGISRAYGDIRYLQRCLAEASAACVHHAPSRGEGYLSYDELLNTVSPMYYPIEKEVQIIAATRNGAYEEVRRLLSDIHDLNLHERRLVPDMQMFLYNNMVTTAIKACESVLEADPAPYERSLRLLSSMNLRNETAEGIFAEILAFYRDICTSLQKRNQNKNRNIMQSVITYLEDNYDNPLLCLDMIADHFHVSYFFLSRIFKEEANQSFSELLNDIRIRHAVKLLGGEDLSNQAIAQAVGYSNISTFLRAFKKRTGTTPQQYRKPDRAT